MKTLKQNLEGKLNKAIKLGLATVFLAGALTAKPSKAMAEKRFDMGIEYGTSCFDLIHLKDENASWRNYVGEQWEDITYPKTEKEYGPKFEYGLGLDDPSENVRFGLKLNMPSSDTKIYQKTYQHPASGSDVFSMTRNETLDMGGISGIVSFYKEAYINWGIGIGFDYNYFNYFLNEETSERSGIYQLKTKDEIRTSGSFNNIYLSGIIGKKLSRHVSIDFSYSSIISNPKYNLSYTRTKTSNEDIDLTDNVGGQITTTTSLERNLDIDRSSTKLGLVVRYEF